MELFLRLDNGLIAVVLMRVYSEVVLKMYWRVFIYIYIYIYFHCDVLVMIGNRHYFVVGWGGA